MQFYSAIFRSPYLLGIDCSTLTVGPETLNNWKLTFKCLCAIKVKKFFYNNNLYGITHVYKYIIVASVWRDSFWRRQIKTKTQLLRI